MQLIRIAIALAGLSAANAACGDAPAGTDTPCDESGRFSVELFGALRADIDWGAAELACEGMPRPQGNGARLRFAGLATVDGLERELAFIVALPELEPGKTARELAATITLMEENGGRFYSNQDNEICWSDVTSQRPLGVSGQQYAITGIAYCLAPLAELNGNASVSIRQLRYSGRIDWKIAD